MIILNAFKPDLNKLGKDLTNSSGTDYLVSIHPSDGIIQISDTENIFNCTITEKKQYPEVEINFNTSIPSGFIEKYIDGLVIPAFVDPEIQEVSDKIKTIFNDYESNDNSGEKYIGASFRFENQQYFLMSSLAEKDKVYEFKVEISKNQQKFKLHAVPQTDFIKTKQQKIVDYVKEIEDYINL